MPGRLRNDTRGCRDVLLKMFMYDDCVISRARSGNTNSESFMFQRIMLPYVVRVPSTAARTRASSPGDASAAPARDSFTVVTDTLSVARVLTPKALKGKLKRTRPRGNTEAPAGARGAKHCTVWMGVPVHFLRHRATFSPRSASILNLCMALRSARRPRRGRWRGQLAERLAQETLGRREALVRVVGKEEVVMGREGRLSGDARALKVIEPRSVLL